MLKSDTTGEYLAWENLSGVYAPYIRSRTPRHFSPCGTTLDRNAPQFFSYPARYFTYFGQPDAPIVEGLVIPLYASGRPLGTMWIMAHDETRHFDAEDVRLMMSLAAFASAALRVISTLETEPQANQTPRAREEPQKAALGELLAAAVGAAWPGVAAWHPGEWQFRRLLEKLPAAADTCDPDGLITYCNPQAIALWGRAPKLNDPVDRFCGSFKLFARDGTPIAHDQCWMALALKMNQEYNGHEIVIERPNGQHLTALAYANPIHDEAGTLLGAVNALVDITERKQAEETIYSLLRISEKLNSTLEVDALLDILVNEAIHLEQFPIRCTGSASVSLGGGHFPATCAVHTSENRSNQCRKWRRGALYPRGDGQQVVFAQGGAAASGILLATAARLTRLADRPQDSLPDE